MSLKAAKVIETKSGNVPLDWFQIKNLPLGFTPTPFYSKRSKFDSKPSKYIPRTRYNEPKNPLDKAANKRAMLTNP